MIKVDTAVTLNEKWRIDSEIVANLTDEDNAKEMNMPLDEYLEFKSTFKGLRAVAFGKEMQEKLGLSYIPTGKELWEFYKETKNK